MADPQSYRPAPGSIPTDPGVYRFWDERERVIYVGKARSLRSRLSSYFQNPHGLHPRTQAMVEAAARVDWVVVGSEAEALSLEYTWIKEFAPRFNIKYRDDKSYPYLAVTMQEEFPRATVMRGERKRGVRYFGPYPQAWAIRETVDLLLRVFPVRSCSSGVFRDAQRSGRPCLLGYIDRCCAPCVGRVSAAEHREVAERFVDFMAGSSQKFIEQLRGQMDQAAQAQDYEQAARLRDDIGALVQATERNTLVFPDGGDFDVIVTAADDVQTAVVLFHIRDGRIRGQRGFMADQREDATDDELLEKLIAHVYESLADSVPPAVMVAGEPSNHEALEQWLSGVAGRRVAIKVPQRGAKREFMETAVKNAVGLLNAQTLKRGHDLTARSEALRQLQEALSLPEAPYRIECIDISNISGTNVVGALIAFEDALPVKRDYRSYIIRGEAGTDDVAAVREVVSRRFAQQAAGVGMPDLLVVDGGQPQVEAASVALAQMQVQVQVIGLAKRLEEVWLPGQKVPLILPRSSEALFLLQRVRDEAHRAAIGFHRKRRSRAMLSSALDAVPGLGPVKRRALLERFGDVKRLSAASDEEIAAVPGIGPSLAAAIRKSLDAPEPHGQTTQP